MDVERKIDFLVEAQARSEARFDHRIDAITKLAQQGMRMLVAQQKRSDKLERALAGLAESQAELAESQKATDRTPRAFIDSMRKGRNRH